MKADWNVNAVYGNLNAGVLFGGDTLKFSQPTFLLIGPSKITTSDSEGLTVEERWRDAMNIENDRLRNKTW